MTKAAFSGSSLDGPPTSELDDQRQRRRAPGHAWPRCCFEAEAAVARVATSHLQQRVVLVGHSGAGLLLPVIADALDVEVAGLVFVDARVPPPGGRSPLGNPEFMDQLRAMATDGLLPTWSRWFGADMMRELVPNERLRGDLEAEMPRLPLSYFEAAVPLPDAWGSGVHAPICS